MASAELSDVKDKMVIFCEQQLLDHQPQNDYRELLKLVLIFLRRKPSNLKNFRAPGPMHKARWMAKAIYSIKVWLCRAQFELTSRESQGFLRVNTFLAKVFIKFLVFSPSN